MANPLQIMQKIQSLQKNMEKMQEDLKITEFTSSTGGGLVNITMNGAYEIKNLQIDDSIISVDEKSMLADLIIAAYNDVRRKVKETTDSKTAELTAGLPIPPSLKGMF